MDQPAGLYEKAQEIDRRRGQMRVSGQRVRPKMASAAAEIAANRFGIGARGGEIDAARGDPRGWLKAQLQPLRFDEAKGSSSQAVKLGAELREERAQRHKQAPATPPQDAAAGRKKRGR